MKIESNKLIRNNISRNNIKYNIINIEPKLNEIDILRKYIRNRLNSFNFNDKIIIYVTTIKLCDFISKELNILKYYADFVDKENQFELFINNNNKNRIIVSTSVLGLEIDLYNI